MAEHSMRWRAGRFATTRWSLVLAAGQGTQGHSAEALANLMTAPT